MSESNEPFVEIHRQRKAESIFDICEVRYAKNEDLNAFYIKFRSIVCDNLKKKGDKSKSNADCDENLPFLQDEIISPTFEEVIVLWCLEKIDPTLPKLVRETFGNQLQGATLKELQGEIFEVIPDFIDYRSKINVRQQVDEDNKIKDSENGLLPRPSDAFKRVKAEQECNTGTELNKKKFLRTFHRVDPIFELSNLNKQKIRTEKLNHLNKINTSPLQLVCKMCMKTFSNNAQLTRHKRFHNSSIIAHTIETTENKHVISPSDDKVPIEINEKFNCKHCDKTYESRKNLQEHSQNCQKDIVENNSIENLHKTHSMDITEDSKNIVTVNDCADSAVDALTNTNGRRRLRNAANGVKYGENKSYSDMSDDEDSRDGDYDPVAANIKYDSELEEDNVDENWREDELLKEKLKKRGKFREKMAQKREKEQKRKEMQEEKKTISNILNGLGSTEEMILSRLTCKLCNESFSDKRSLLRHKQFDHGIARANEKKKKRNQHKIKKIDCDLCSEKFEFKKDLKSHMLESHNEKMVDTFPCEVCGKILKGNFSLQIHVKTHERNLNCTICSMKCESYEVFKDHMNRIHQMSTSYVNKVPCELCGKLVAPGALTLHRRRAHATKMKCPTCKRGFESQEKLGSHLCKHFTCEICGEKYLYIRNYKFHKREHAGEFMYHCDLCEGLFVNKRRLLAHRSGQHMKQEHFKCDVCGKEFNRKYCYKKHMRIHNTDVNERPHKCEECGVAFRNSSSLSNHKKIHSNELPFECDGCKMKFRTVGNLKIHKEDKTCGIEEEDLYKYRLDEKGYNKMQ